MSASVHPGRVHQYCGFLALFVTLHGLTTQWREAVGGVLILMFIVRPQWLRHWIPWAVVSGLFLLRTITQWYAIDNHQFLFLYLVLLFTIAAADNFRSATSLALASRLLIGFVFLAAVVSKLMSPSYLDGSMFEFLLLTDPRIAAMLAPFVDALPSAAQALRETLHTGIEQPIPLNSKNSELISRASQFLTYGTLVFEWIIAFLFLLPLATKPFVLVRSVFLSLFCLGTYFFAPVIGFGHALLLLCYMHLPPGSRSSELVLLGSMSMLMIYLLELGFLLT